METLRDIDLEELILKRKNWLESNKENGFNFEHILVGLYSDASHFIYEILQNTEDAGASTISFHLFEDRLEVVHNGVDFTYANIDAITSIGNSTKKDDINKIGKFGVGFKSVYAITKSPYIFSGSYCIKIEDFVLPCKFEKVESVLGTKIILPFNHEKRTQDECFDLVYRRLKNLGLRTLLFLKNLEEIQWECHGESGTYLKNINGENRDTKPYSRRVTLLAEDAEADYLVFEKEVLLSEKQLSVEIAFRMEEDEDGKITFVPERDSKLVVYFPTEKETYLNFVIQGPYKTTPARDNIPLDDIDNIRLIEETGILLTESILEIKKMGYLTVDFLEILPINDERLNRDELYTKIFESVNQLFLSDEELLPTSDNGYTSVEKALLAEVRSLTELLDQSDNNFLFNRQHWLDTSITENRTRDLWNYLRDYLEVETVDYESFSRRITADFLSRKSNEWLVQFYTRLMDQPALLRSSENNSRKGVLRNKPFIKLSNGEFIEPFDQKNHVQVYLPSSSYTSSQYNIVDLSLIDDQKVLEFMKMIGLTEPDLFAEVKDFILPKYHSEEPLINDYEGDVAKIISAYNKVPSDKKKSYVDLLRNTSFVLAANHLNEFEIRYPNDVYFPSKDLKIYFSNNPEIYYLSDKFLSCLEEFETKNEFLNSIGINYIPKLIGAGNTLTYEERTQLRKDSSWNDERYSGYESFEDYNLDGFENCFKKITIEKSVALWNLLHNYVNYVGADYFKKKLRAKYIWQYYSERYNYYEVYFLRLMKQKAWLFDKNANCKRTNELSVSELNESYEINELIQPLINALSFKPDIEQLYLEQLSEDDKEHFKKFKELKANGMFEKVLTMLEKEKDNELATDDETDLIDDEDEFDDGNVNSWIPEVQPDIVVSDISEYTLPSKKIPQMSHDRDGNHDYVPIADQSGKEDPLTLYGKLKGLSFDHQKIKEIGEWGEKFVMGSLLNSYKKIGMIHKTENGFKVKVPNSTITHIQWLNQGNNSAGKGYDILVTEDGKEIKYIEVKAKVKNEPELISLSGNQWEVARKLYKEGKGEKYSIFVIYGAGTANAKIEELKNPFKLWLDGEIYAHPVNIKL